MRYNTELKEEYFDEWPKRYYDLSPEVRKAALLSRLHQFPDSEEDKRLLELLEKRFVSAKDQYLFAWMMLKVLANEPVNFLNRKKHEREIRQYFALLGTDRCDAAQKREWEDFAEAMIRNYSESPAFRAAIFGMGSVGDRNTIYRLASEIIEVTEKVPASIGIAQETAAFAEVIREQFFRMIPESREIYAEVQSR